MPRRPVLKLVDITALKATCSVCSLHELCLPMGLAMDEVEALDRLTERRRILKKGEKLYSIGSSFGALFAVRYGFFKTQVLQEDGREQVTGFHMMGELMGMDAISSDAHTCDAVALEDSEACEIDFTQLERLSRAVPALQHQFHKLMSREIVRDHGVMLLLGSMRAEERLATFLLNLSQRFAARGYSATDFVLRMTREEIGSYLGLKLETVSRAFSRLQNQGLITVQGREVKISHLSRLRTVISHCTS